MYPCQLTLTNENFGDNRFLFTFVKVSLITMINNSEFADRLLKIMEQHQLSASAFADRIQVQRSSISHLLSGRNKPSLDFVMKVVKEFEDVELYWLLNGKGSYPPAPASAEAKESILKIAEEDHTEAIKASKAQDPMKAIERIVVFYSDGTFKAYNP